MDLILNQGVRDGLTGKIIFEERPGRSEGIIMALGHLTYNILLH